MDKASRKRLKHQVRDQERAAALRAFPLPTSALEEMFEAVDADFKLLGCDKTRRLTKAWLLDRGHDVDRVFAWLDAHGGFCDCEVVSNARQHFNDAKLAALN